MQTLMANFGAVVLWMGVLDAVMLLLLGITAAIFMLLGWETGKFYERITPAVLILVGSSVGAGVVMLVARWLSHLVS